MVVDTQYGYERAYFDNYRNQMIFIREGKLGYLIDGKKVDTQGEEGITGYIKQVVLSPNYQIGIEILDIQRDSLGQGAFYGERTRIIDLGTRDSVIVDGVMFAHAFIANHYLYNLVFDYDGNEFLDMIDLRTMEHTRIGTAENNITFMYQVGDNVYAQVSSKKTAFLLDGKEMIERKELYNETLPVLESAMEYIDDIAPMHSNNHWYIEPHEDDIKIKETRLLNVHPDGKINETILKFENDNVVHITDATNYGVDHVAIFYRTKEPGTEDLGAYVAIYDLNGKKVETREITSLKGNDTGRFTYLDYVE